MKIQTSIIILSLAFTALLSGCTTNVQDEKERVVNASVDILCDAKNIQKKFMHNQDGSGAAIEMIEELENMSNIIVKKHGFKNLQDFELINKKYDSDEIMKEEARKRIKEQCKLDIKDTK